MEKNAFNLHPAPYFFIFFFLWAFATSRFTSKRFEPVRPESQRIRRFYLKDNRSLQQFSLVNIKRLEKYTSIIIASLRDSTRPELRGIRARRA
jgi:hypothetical protein